MLSYATDLRADFPELATRTLQVAGITPEPDVTARVERHLAAARRRLEAGLEGDLAEIQAWRRAFASLGLKPTQYRCAAEALLRRLRKDADLPRVHPLVDLCNAASAAFAIPVAVFDLGQIDGTLRVQRATGAEIFRTFGAQTEHPEPGEVIFADASHEAHARRWTHRQSGRSAVTRGTTRALLVAEALHEGGEADVAALIDTLAADVAAIWPAAALTPGVVR